LRLLRKLCVNNYVSMLWTDIAGDLTSAMSNMMAQPGWQTIFVTSFGWNNGGEKVTYINGVQFVKIFYNLFIDQCISSTFHKWCFFVIIVHDIEYLLHLRALVFCVLTFPWYRTDSICATFERIVTRRNSASRGKYVFLLRSIWIEWTMFFVDVK